MVDRFLKTQSCFLLVIQYPDVEGERPSFLVDLTEDFTRGLHFELICNRRIALIDSGLGVLLPRLIVAMIFSVRVKTKVQ